MSTQITEAFVQEYVRGIDMLVQQKGSRFRNAVRLETGIVGKQAFFDQIGATAAVLKTSRHGDTPQIDTPHSRRMAPMSDYEWADLVDDPDKVRVLNDPTNSYSQNASNAMGRAMDDVVIAAAFGTAATGETGTGTASLAAANQVAIGGGAMTAAKVIEAKRILKSFENDPDDPYWLAINAATEEELLVDTTNRTVSRDFVGDRPLVDGMLRRYMGFNVILSERLGTDGNGDERALAWRQSALTLAIGRDSRGRISERPDKSYSVQVFYAMTIGSVRMEEAGVVEIAAKNP